VAVAVLMLYGVPFSFAYTGLTAGTGALILFGCVQVTMFALAKRRGERVRTVQWAGVALALAGLTYLVRPALATPAFVPAVLMTMAGVFWGVYSWLGRAVGRPLAVNARNFVFALPLALLINVGTASEAHAAMSGVLLAATSGAIATGLGYVIWYAALPGLSGAEGAVVQLSVPLLAAAGGVLFLDEPLSLRLVLSAAMVLGGVALTVAGGRR
jgi:drug/metabolite transporter (DMT)-like permease